MRQKKKFMSFVSKERCDPQIYSFEWIFNTPNIHNSYAYFEFFEKTMNTQFQTI